jgi:hypothetical protein
MALKPKNSIEVGCAREAARNESHRCAQAATVIHRWTIGWWSITFDCLHSVFKKVIRACLSSGLNSLKRLAGSRASLS